MHKQICISDNFNFVQPGTHVIIELSLTENWGAIAGPNQNKYQDILKSSWLKLREKQRYGMFSLQTYQHFTLNFIEIAAVRLKQIFRDRHVLLIEQPFGPISFWLSYFKCVWRCDMKSVIWSYMKYKLYIYYVNMVINDTVNMAIMIQFHKKCVFSNLSTCY